MTFEQIVCPWSVDSRQQYDFVRFVNYHVIWEGKVVGSICLFVSTLSFEPTDI